MNKNSPDHKTSVRLPSGWEEDEGGGSIVCLRFLWQANKKGSGVYHPEPLWLLPRKESLFTPLYEQAFLKMMAKFPLSPTDPLRIFT
jgi:hypothetical protein